MEESRVRELIEESLGEAGAVKLAIQSALSSSIGELGAVKIHVQTALAACLDGPIQDAINKAKSEMALEDRADKEYPYRKILRAATPSLMSAAWRSLMVDPDHIQALSEGLHESGVATILALQATHPDNPDLLQLKQHAAMKNAPRVTWKSLCLPSRGGGSDRLQVFLLERAESCEDHLIRALARAVLALHMLLEKRYTVSQNLKKNGPRKSELQRAELMPLVYECIKAFKRRTTKVTSAARLDNEILLHDFGVDVMIGEAHMRAKGEDDSLKRAAEMPEGRGQKFPKQAATAAGAWSAPPAQLPLGKGQDKGAKSCPAKEALQGKLAAFIPGKSAEQIQVFLDEHFQRDEHRKAMADIMRAICRNCLLAGRGFARHPMSRCRELGNQCVLKCSKCLQSGRTNMVHWQEDCPYQ